MPGGASYGSAALRIQSLGRQLHTGGSTRAAAVGTAGGRHWLHLARPISGPVRRNTTAAAASNVKADVTLYTARSTFPAFNVGWTAATQMFVPAIGL